MSKDPNKYFLVDATTANKVLNYLANKPWIEVREMVPGLMNLKEGVEVTAPAIQVETNPTLAATPVANG